MGDPNLPAAWDKAWSDFGRLLLENYPNELGPEPDFSADGNARVFWSMRGFVAFQTAYIALGVFDKIQIGDKTYSEYPYGSVLDQNHIAHQAFIQGQKYWEEAKADSDRRKQDALAKEQTANGRKNELFQLSESVKTADTVKQLEIQEGEFSGRLGAVQKNTAPEEISHLHQCLSLIRARMVQLERQNTRKAMRWAYIGAVLGVIGVAFPLWDEFIRKPTEASSGQTDKIAAPRAAGSTESGKNEAPKLIENRQ